MTERTPEQLKEIGEDLNDNGIDDNPFDAMLFHSLELARELLFACERMRNDDYPDFLRCTDMTIVDSRIDLIKNELSTLLNLKDESVKLCRETAYYNKHMDEFNNLNESILKAEHCMETLYTRRVPNRDDLFEKARLGEESSEYQRLLTLRHFVESPKVLGNLNKYYLTSMIDVIENKEKCIEYGWMSKAEYDEKINLIKRYHLDEYEIKYMIAYKFKY